MISGPITSARKHEHYGLISRFRVKATTCKTKVEELVLVAINSYKSEYWHHLFMFEILKK